MRLINFISSLVDMKMRRFCIVTIFLSFWVRGELKIPFLFKVAYCANNDCETLGQIFEGSLNRSVNPCKNFYKFSCGAWESKNKKPPSEPVWGNWQIIAAQINDRIEDILLKQPSGTNIGLEKAARFYKACVNTTLPDYKYLNNLKLFVKDVRGWPMVQKTNLSNYNWFSDILKINKLLASFPIFKVDVNIDYKNTSRHALYIEPGDLIFPRYILSNPRKYSVELNAYKLWILETAAHLYKIKPNRIIKSDVMKIIKFEIRMAKFHARDSRNQRITIAEFSKVFSLDWQNVLQNIIIDKRTNLRDDDIIIIKNYMYFKNVISFLKRTDGKSIANYLMWYVVKTLSRETTKYMRHLNYLVDKAVLGVQSDITRRTECLNNVNNYFHYALLPIYIQQHTSPNTFVIVEDMVNNIKLQFVDLIRNSSWLSEKTKSLSVEKIKHLNYYVGYPIWVKNITALNDYYKMVNISHNHFLNVVSLKKFLMGKQLSKYNTPVDEIRWPSSPLDVNAYYSILQNAIFIPLGLLEPPFFHVNVPDIFNYGALGTLIGHEITHSLDVAGRQSEKNGNVNKWWSDGDIEEYGKRAVCYEQLYNKFDVNGVLTLGENIADSVGLEMSFSAYRHLKSSNYYTVIPHLETYKNEQLFYMTFAQMWCETSEQSDMFVEDEHAPVESRVMGTLHNQNFRRFFDCEVTQNNYCTLWS